MRPSVIRPPIQSSGKTKRSKKEKSKKGKKHEI
jgi:hypothetical protein